MGQVTALIASLGRAEERVEMLREDPVEDGVLGVARTIHRLGWRHAQGYRARRALPHAQRWIRRLRAWAERRRAFGVGPCVDYV
jgi:hypothetical protein